MNWRINTYGTNKLPPEKSFRIIDFNRMFRRFNTKALLISTIISFVICLLKEGLKAGWIEGSEFFGAVFIVTVISSSLMYNE